MSIDKPNTIEMTQKEWLAIEERQRVRLCDMAVEHGLENCRHVLTFAGISDKQIATELCAYYGLKVGA